MSINSSHVLQGKLIFPFIAPPNGGKGTQTQILSQRYNLPTFDMGATFRAILKDGADPDLAQELQSYMGAGKLVPIATVVKVFRKGFEALATQNPTAKGFILDGFPRNKDQADALMKLTQEWGSRLAKVIYLNVPMSVVEQRATGRRFCSKDAKHLYNVNEPRFAPKSKKLKADGTPETDDKGREIWLCNVDGADLIVRPDDEPSTVQQRLKEYRQETDPLIDEFRKNELLAEIKGDQAPEAVTRDIEQVMQPLLNLTPSA